MARSNKRRRNSGTDFKMVHIKPVRGPGEDWRTAAWDSSDRPPVEQWLIELMRHTQGDGRQRELACASLEQFVADAERGIGRFEPKRAGDFAWFPLRWPNGLRLIDLDIWQAGVERYWDDLTSWEWADAEWPEQQPFSPPTPGEYEEAAAAELARVDAELLEVHSKRTWLDRLFGR